MERIVHMTAKTKKLTWEERVLLRHNKRIMKDWDFILHDDADNDLMVKEYFPQFYNKWQRIKRGVAKADIARIMYLYLYGGIYIDTDYKIVKNFEKFKDWGKYKVFLPISRDIDEQFSYGLGNAVMMADKSQSFFYDFLEYLFENDTLENISEDKVELTTGPQGITEFYFKWSEKNGDLINVICTPPRIFFHPIYTYNYFLKERDSFGYHLCWASWRTKSLKTNVTNNLRRKLTALI